MISKECKELIEKDLRSLLTYVENISLEDMTFLVTGGAGFLGSWICDVLVKKGARVICVDNLSSGLLENISHLLNLENFTLEGGNIRKQRRFLKN